MSLKNIRAVALGGALLSAALVAMPALAEPWFGQKLPPPVNDPTKPVVAVDADDLPEQPARFGPGPTSPLLAGARIKQDLKTILGFSLQSKAAGDFLWGRVTGTKAYYDAVTWSAADMKASGLKDSHLEEFTTELTTPTAGEARILGDASYGDGSSDVLLDSVMVGGRGPVNGSVTAPMIFVGHATQADLLGRDVKGKIAVLHTTPNPGIYSTDENGRAMDLSKMGAAGVIEIFDQAGNMKSYDTDRHGCGTGLCVTVGGADGFFLENMLGKAGAAGKTVSAKLSATATDRTGLKAANAVATIPGKTGKTIIVNFHADAWFIGGDDNGSGFAVGQALARYFAKQPKLNHTLVFMASAGHHSQGRGIPEFRKLHDQDYVKNASLIINLEHVGSSGLVRATANKTDNFSRAFDTTTTELSKAVGVTNMAPFVINIWKKGAECFGLGIQRVMDNRAPGEPGAYNDIKTVPITQMIAAGEFYHTTGDTYDSIPAAGLERAARFYAYMIETADKASDAELQGAPATQSPGCPKTP